jgi:hypothetical protein
MFKKKERVGSDAESEHRTPEHRSAVDIVGVVIEEAILDTEAHQKSIGGTPETRASVIEKALQRLKDKGFI